MTLFNSDFCLSPKMKSKKSLIILHGFNSKKESLIPFSEVFNKNGFQVYLIDLAYHGNMEPENKDDWLYKSVTGSVESLKKVIEKLREKDASRIYLIGVSLGSTIIDIFLRENFKKYKEIKKVVYMLFNPNILNTLKRNMINRETSRYLTYKKYLLLKRRYMVSDHQYNCKIPIHIINGKDDPWIPWREVEDLFKKLLKENSENSLTTFSGESHDINREMMLKALSCFLSG